MYKYTIFHWYYIIEYGIGIVLCCVENVICSGCTAYIIDTMACLNYTGMWES